MNQLKKFFPTDLSKSEWIEFHAKGFSKPVTGIIYRGGKVQPGIPLGSIGTGFINLGTDGTLDYFNTIFNSFLERYYYTYKHFSQLEHKVHRNQIPKLRLPFVGIAIDGKTFILSLKKVQNVKKTKKYFTGVTTPLLILSTKSTNQ